MSAPVTSQQQAVCFLRSHGSQVEKAQAAACIPRGSVSHLGKQVQKSREVHGAPRSSNSKSKRVLIVLTLRLSQLSSLRVHVALRAEPRKRSWDQHLARRVNALTQRDQSTHSRQAGTSCTMAWPSNAPNALRNVEHVGNLQAAAALLNVEVMG